MFGRQDTRNESLYLCGSFVDVVAQNLPEELPTTRQHVDWRHYRNHMARRSRS